VVLSSPTLCAIAHGGDWISPGGAHGGDGISPANAETANVMVSVIAKHKRFTLFMLSP
jgi:hypothetical protein